MIENANKFSRLINENMTSDEARDILYSHADGLSSEGTELLWQAYLPVSQGMLKSKLDQIKV